MENKKISEVTDNHNQCEVENLLNDANLLVENINNKESDLCTIQNKQLHLENIQRDLDDLMFNLNSFIADSANEIGDHSASGDEILNDLTEKQDGLSEKELNLIDRTTNFMDNIYITDGYNPPEINWEAVGPIIQKHIADLRRLHVLNKMTNAVINRIRNESRISEALLEESRKQGDSSETDQE